MKRFPLLIVICALAVFGLAACGGDDNKDTTTEPAATEPATTETTTTGAGAGGGKTVAASADPGGALEFVKKSLTAPRARTPSISPTSPPLRTTSCSSRTARRSPRRM